MLIEDALKQATDAQIKSEWARRTQAMRKTKNGGRRSGLSTEMPRYIRKPAMFKDGVPDVGVVGLARLLEKKSSHDAKICRVYKCGMCAAVKA